jgi:CHAT domain-containing protein/tetratricopeptide (TPR) repeat protein
MAAPASAAAPLTAAGQREAMFEAADLNHRVDALISAGKYQEALPLALRAVALKENLTDYSSEYMVISLRVLGQVYTGLGMDDDALRVYLRAFDTAEQAMGLNHARRAEAMVDLAGAHESLGNFDKALTMVRRALSILELGAERESYDTAVALSALADMYIRLNKYREAEPLLERALAIQTRLGSGESLNDKSVLTTLASVRQHLGKPESALPLLQRALAISEKWKGPDHPDTAAVLNDLALCCHENQWLSGLELLVRAMTITQDALGPDHPATVVSYANLALTYLEASELDLSRRLLQKALTAGRLGLNSEQRQFVLAATGRYFVEEKIPVTAILFYKMAVNTTQEIRSKTSSEKLHKALLKKNENLYKTLADLLLTEGRLPEAQRVLAMLKEDEYRDFIRRSADAGGNVSRIGYTGAEQRWASRLEELLGAIAHLALQGKSRRQPSVDGDDGALPASSQMMKSLKQQVVQLINDMTWQLPAEHARAAAFEPASDVEPLESIEKNTAQISYLLLGKRLRILVARPGRHVAVDVPIDESVLYPKLVAFRSALENPKQDPLPSAIELYRILFKPVEKELRGATTLVLSLDGALRYIPFAALHDGKRYLVQRYRIALRTAATGNRKNLPRPKELVIAGLGVTQAHPGFKALPGVRQELEGILSAVGLTGKIYLDQEFTARRLQETLKRNFSVLHIASHFQFSPGAESDSFLLLGDGTRLSLQDLRKGDYRFDSIDLLTLSACATAMEGGLDIGGREIEGLAVVAQRKGAQSVIATLWPIDDGGTAAFMKTLYLARLSVRMDKAGALQAAQLALLQGRAAKKSSDKKAGRRSAAAIDAGAKSTAGSYSHPSYWAPFILMGDWR